jgi:hypothetical protein
MSEDPDSPPVITEFAWVLYLAGRVDEALPYFEQALDFVPQGRPISHPMSLPLTMGLALARRKAEDEQSAQAAAGIVRQDLAARRAAGQKNQNLNLTEAMIAAFEHDPDGVITALNSAIQGGLRKVEVFDYPIFEEMRDEPRFVALQQELEAILAVEHDKLLQLICFNNPVPDDWRPMPETCEGVVEQ